MELICHWGISDQWVSCASVIYVKKALQETYEGPKTNYCTSLEIQGCVHTKRSWK